MPCVGTGTELLGQERSAAHLALPGQLSQTHISLSWLWPPHQALGEADITIPLQGKETIRQKSNEADVLR